MAIREQISSKFSRFKKKGDLRIADYLDINLVTFLHSKSRDEAIETLVDCLDRAGKLEGRRDRFHEAILRRESIVSTGIGMGVAIPHAKFDELDCFFMVVGIQRKRGLEWDSIDGTSVKLIFMIGGPDNRQDDYLRILSKLTAVIKDEYLRKRLLLSEDKGEIMSLLSEF